jgi:leucine dehydrogenase
MMNYPSWADGLRDALLLSEAMSLKCAAAGIPHGGGKTVIALPPLARLDSTRRVAVMQDLGDLVQGLGGSYYVGEDVGTGPQDMRVVRERTPFAAGPRQALEDSGERPEPTAVGVFEAIRATARHVFGSDGLAGLHMVVIGLGHVGLPLARMLATAGASLALTDVAEDRKAAAAELGAQWLEPGEALYASTDIVVPAALGGILTAESAALLRCAAIVGPANNQLSDDRVAAGLRERGIVWAPDFIVNSGGVLFETSTQLDHLSAEDALSKVRDIGARLAGILARSADAGTTPLAVAIAEARSRLGRAARVSGQQVS